MTLSTRNLRNTSPFPHKPCSDMQPNPDDIRIMGDARLRQFLKAVLGHVQVQD